MSFNRNDWLDEMEHIDCVAIYDRSGRLVYSLRYNSQFNEKVDEEEYANNINKNVLEVCPSLTSETSSVISCIRTGETIYLKRQEYYDFKGRNLTTQNITFPIIKYGKIIGAVELTKDIKVISDLAKDNNLDYINFKDKNYFGSKTLKYNFNNIITNNDNMKDCIKRAKLLSNTNSPVLIYGETGTGKELFVQSIHNFGKRCGKPFIVQNCAALPDNLFESILFGTTKGSFTGAVDKKGLFELADGGTLFLDEINSMPLSLQPKLLRVLQDGVIRRIGDAEEVKVDVRVIAAMNTEPLKALENKLIREDLFYRLNVNSIKILPLRERRSDVMVLTGYFINKYNFLLEKNITGLSNEAKMLFQTYNWPGNVRELEHVIEGAINICEDTLIDIGNLPAYFFTVFENSNTINDDIDIDDSLTNLLNIIEKNIIVKALKNANGNVTKSSKNLKISRQSLQYKMQKFNI